MMHELMQDFESKVPNWLVFAKKPSKVDQLAIIADTMEHPCMSMISAKLVSHPLARKTTTAA